MNKRARNEKLLASILAALVEEFGIDAVAGKLADISGATQGNPYPSKWQQDQSKTNKKKITRFSGMKGMVEALPKEEKKRESLSVLAERFDEKRFLPTMGDVRHFVEMRGGSVRAKQRADAARSLLLLLSSMSVENLQKIIEADSYSGPSQLGPLADAIKDASVSIRSSATVEQRDELHGPEDSARKGEEGRENLQGKSNESHRSDKSG